MRLNEVFNQLIAVKPSDENEAKEFIEFRKTDVAEMLRYVIAFTIAACIILGLACIGDPSLLNFLKLIGEIMIALVFVINWIIVKSNPSKYSFTVIIGMFAAHLVTFGAIELVMTVFKGNFAGK